MKGQTDSSASNSAGKLLPPAVLKTANPESPPNAPSGNYTVTVTFKLDENGIPGKIVVIKTDDPLFNQSAIDAARKYKFRPATRDGKPAVVVLTLSFHFSIP